MYILHIHIYQFTFGKLLHTCMHTHTYGNSPPLLWQDERFRGLLLVLVITFLGNNL